MKKNEVPRKSTGKSAIQYDRESYQTTIAGLEELRAQGQKLLGKINQRKAEIGPLADYDDDAMTKGILKSVRDTEAMVVGIVDKAIEALGGEMPADLGRAGKVQDRTEANNESTGRWGGRHG